MIPFDVTIPDSEQDKNLPAKLQAELPGILNWALAGCLAWQSDGLGTPDDIAAATSEYRSAQDVLGVFLADKCIVADGCQAKASDLYATYSAYMRSSNEHVINQRAFGQAMTERGFERFKNNGYWYRGVGLRDETDRSEPTEPTEPIFPIHATKRA